METPSTPATPPSRTPRGKGKEATLFASMNNMSVKEVARHFNINPMSVYKASNRMGIVLKKDSFINKRYLNKAG
jgi:hypothetical protein